MHRWFLKSIGVTGEAFDVYGCSALATITNVAHAGVCR